MDDNNIDLTNIDAPDSMRLLEGSMSNFYFACDPGVEKELKDRAGKVYADYAGWNFHANVWFFDGLYRARVKCYGANMEVITSKSIDGLMTAVSDKYGYQ